MNNSTVHLLDSEGHLTEDGLLLYYQQMAQDQLETIPVEVFEHVTNCLACRVELLRYQTAVTQMKTPVSETPVIPINQTTTNHQNILVKKPIRKRFWPLLAAASLVGLLLFAGLFFSRQTTNQTIVVETHTNERDQEMIGTATNTAEKSIAKKETQVSSAEMPPNMASKVVTNKKKEHTIATKKAITTPPIVEAENVENRKEAQKPAEKRTAPKESNTKEVLTIGTPKKNKSVLESEKLNVEIVENEAPEEGEEEIVYTPSTKEVTELPLVKKEEKKEPIRVVESNQKEQVVVGSITTLKVAPVPPSSNSTSPEPPAPPVAHSSSPSVPLASNPKAVSSVKPPPTTIVSVPKKEPKPTPKQTSPKKEPRPELFAMHYQPAELYLNTIRSADNDAFNEVIMKAGEAYEAGKMKQAAQLFKEAQNLDPQNMTLQFYEGVCLLSPAVNQVGEARTIFKKIVADKDNYYIEQGEWYLALTYLQEKKEKEAVTWFTKIKELEGRFANKASQILDQLLK